MKLVSKKRTQNLRDMGTEDLQKKAAAINTTNENKLNVKGQKKKKTSLEERKRTEYESDHVDQTNVSGLPQEHKRKNLKKKRRENENKEELHNIEKLGENIEDKNNEEEEKKKMKSKKKKRRNEEGAELDNTDNEKLEDSGLETENQFEGSEASWKAGIGTKIRNRSGKKARKSKTVEEPKDEQVPEISSGDEDSSKGMRKWVMEYKQSRPDLKVLQERIDDFITAHEAQEGQARKEREAQAAEGGWTVVVHHKGRKKTTDPESGIAVGSVAPAAVLDKMAKKKNKEVGLDFYRFQKREAHRNEIMMLQSKFEQDKKRIQQLRAQRKFKPY